jgi:uncharacterized membrane protein
MSYGFLVAYIFTKNAGESASIIFVTGTTLTFLQWFFEILWDKYVRVRLKYALSKQQSRIDRLVRWRRSARALSVDQHDSRSYNREAVTNPLSPENAGREWT